MPSWGRTGRRDFAEIVNELFPDRKLYLFDTFEGFDQHDVSVEHAQAYSSGKQDFSQTSIELILKKMRNPEACVIKKGRFPESAADVNDTFAFVSIDADLYAPIAYIRRPPVLLSPFGPWWLYLCP